MYIITFDISDILTCIIKIRNVLYSQKNKVFKIPNSPATVDKNVDIDIKTLHYIVDVFRF